MGYLMAQYKEQQAFIADQRDRMIHFDKLEKELA
jgi:hypothetical protein